jgi:hypothetical protein
MYCGKKNTKCQHKTKSGGCTFVHYICPYGPRSTKPKSGEWVEDIEQGGGEPCVIVDKR